MNKPKQIVIYAKDMDGNKVKKYETEMVYIAFQSEVGCTLEFTMKGMTLSMQKKLKMQHSLQGGLDISKMPSNFEE